MFQRLYPPINSATSTIRTVSFTIVSLSHQRTAITDLNHIISDLARCTSHDEQCCWVKDPTLSSPCFSHLLVRTSAPPLLRRFPSLSLPFSLSQVITNTASTPNPLVHYHHHLTAFPESCKSLPSRPNRQESNLLSSYRSAFLPAKSLSLVNQLQLLLSLYFSDASPRQMGPGIAVGLSGQVGMGARGLQVPRGYGAWLESAGVGAFVS